MVSQPVAKHLGYGRFTDFRFRGRGLGRLGDEVEFDEPVAGFVEIIDQAGYVGIEQFDALDLSESAFAIQETVDPGERLRPGTSAPVFGQVFLDQRSELFPIGGFHFRFYGGVFQRLSSIISA